MTHKITVSSSRLVQLTHPVVVLIGTEASYNPDYRSAWSQSRCRTTTGISWLATFVSLSTGDVGTEMCTTWRYQDCPGSTIQLLSPKVASQTDQYKTQLVGEQRKATALQTKVSVRIFLAELLIDSAVTTRADTCFDEQSSSWRGNREHEVSTSLFSCKEMAADRCRYRILELEQEVRSKEMEHKKVANQLFDAVGHVRWKCTESDSEPELSILKMNSIRLGRHKQNLTKYGPCLQQWFTIPRNCRRDLRTSNLSLW